MSPAPLVWDAAGTKTYETGVDRGVLYQAQSDGTYSDGEAWNGLTTVTETPAGAGSTALYADNQKYLNLVAAETFGGTIQAYTYPDAFAQNDGTAYPKLGVAVGQQGRKTFGLAYRTKLGNDTDGADHGFKLHLVWGAIAQPSQKAFATVNDSPSAIEFSWQFDTTPISAGDTLKPTSLIIIDSTKVAAADLTSLETLLYGTATVGAALPLPADVIALFSTAEPAGS
jgi:hypothetical protein